MIRAGCSEAACQKDKKSPVKKDEKVSDSETALKIMKADNSGGPV